MTAIYNEIASYPAAWLRNLIAAGHIADGVVDERSIVELKATELVGHGQRHFFAGLGGWSRALRLAGWPDDRPVWTASCPCQPFSQAGRKRGTADERHLWPVVLEFVRECRPGVLFGEQVASGAGLEWLDTVLADLETEGHAVWAADLAAAGVGAPHIRQRLYFVAVRLGHANSHGGRRVGGDVSRAEAAGRYQADDHGSRDAGSLAGSAWSDAEWIACRDGRARPVGRGIRALAHGLPGRVERVRAAGNAIVPQVAAAFVRSVMPWIDAQEAS